MNFTRVSVRYLILERSTTITYHSEQDQVWLETTYYGRNGTSLCPHQSNHGTMNPLTKADPYISCIKIIIIHHPEIR